VSTHYAWTDCVGVSVELSFEFVALLRIRDSLALMHLSLTDTLTAMVAKNDKGIERL